MVDTRAIPSVKPSVEYNESCPWCQPGSLLLFHKTTSRDTSTRWHLRIFDLMNFVYPCFSLHFFSLFLLLCHHQSSPPLIPLLSKQHTHEPTCLGIDLASSQVYRGQGSAFMEKFVQLISGGLEMQDSSLSLSSSNSCSLSSSVFFFLLLCFLWLNMHFLGLEWRQRGKGKTRTSLFWVFNLSSRGKNPLISGGGILVDLAEGHKMFDCVSLQVSPVPHPTCCILRCKSLLLCVCVFFDFFIYPNKSLDSSPQNPHFYEWNALKTY